MSALWLALLAVSLILLTGFAFVQLLYLESLRLRARDSEALEYFKENIAPELGFETDHGALVFSLYKHGLLVCTGALGILISYQVGLPLALVGMAVCSYLAPQLMYRRSSGRILRLMVPPLKVAALFMRPFAAILSFAETIAEISKPSESLEEGASPQEEIEALIAAGEEEGLIEEGDKKLIQSVMAFGDKRVREVMTPRPKIVAIEASKTIEELRRLVIHEQFSRIPVYETDIHSITGFVHVRDMFEVEYEDRTKIRASDIQRAIALVPETKLVRDLLREMQHDGNHMAIVVDEYGETAGLATMEDLVEEVFGEIRDEHEPEHDVTNDADGSFIVAGSFDVDHLRDLLAYSPAETLESTTVGGLATEWFGRVPKAGETMERDGIVIEVISSDDLRVDRVRLRKAPETTTEEADAEANEAQG
jgi:CBS domain containing-hemolysin-like protein